ncbi:hypothetical protein ACLOJK_008463 [Asimina triloba]
MHEDQPEREPIADQPNPRAKKKRQNDHRCRPWKEKMSEEEGKSRGIVSDHHQHQPPQYGTFQGYPQPAIGFPQPAPPPGAVGSAPPYYPPAHGYQAVPGTRSASPLSIYAKGGIAICSRRMPLNPTDPAGTGRIRSIFATLMVWKCAAVAEGRPMREPRLPCCGIGLGWFLYAAEISEELLGFQFMFIIGFFLAAIPWYVGALIVLCSRVDYREKPGFIACTIAVSIYTSSKLLYDKYPDLIRQLYIILYSVYWQKNFLYTAKVPSSVCCHIRMLQMPNVCHVQAVLAAVAILLGVTKGAHDWWAQNRGKGKTRLKEKKSEKPVWEEMNIITMTDL